LIPDHHNWVDCTRPTWRLDDRIDAFLLRLLGAAPISVFRPRPYAPHRDDGPTHRPIQVPTDRLIHLPMLLTLAAHGLHEGLHHPGEAVVSRRVPGRV
jgi:hypothetical protein